MRNSVYVERFYRYKFSCLFGNKLIKRIKLQKDANQANRGEIWEIPFGTFAKIILISYYYLSSNYWYRHSCLNWIHVQSWNCSALEPIRFLFWCLGKGGRNRQTADISFVCLNPCANWARRELKPLHGVAFLVIWSGFLALLALAHAVCKKQSIGLVIHITLDIWFGEGRRLIITLFYQKQYFTNSTNESAIFAVYAGSRHGLNIIALQSHKSIRDSTLNPLVSGLLWGVP